MRRNQVLINLAVVALFSALYFVLSKFSITITNNFKISFVSVIIIYASISFPIYVSMPIALVGEFLNQLFSEYGLTITTPLWMIPPLLRIFPIFIGYKLFRRKNIDLIASQEPLCYVFFFIICLIGNGLTTAGNSLVIYLDGLIMNYPTGLTMSVIGIRFAISFINGIIASLIVMPLYLATKNQVFKTYNYQVEKNGDQLIK